MTDHVKLVEALRKRSRSVVSTIDGRSVYLLEAAADAIEALTEPPTDEWEYGSGYQADNGHGLRWFPMPETGYIIREAAENEIAAYADPQVRLLRRRPAGPWEVVPDGD